jgi:lipid-A-disaccharide synthase
MVAGEASGDLLAAHLLRAINGRWLESCSFGIGGAQMEALGFDAWWPSDCLAVRGYVEVLRHYRGIVRIRDALQRRLIAHPPSVFIGVDAPDFNLKLAEDLKAAGIPTIHFVCPSIWAWRPKRVEQLKRSVDHVLCIFPFESALLAGHGIASTFVGHPLASLIPYEADRTGARLRLGLDNLRQLVAVLPGSRLSELHYLGPRFMRTVKLLLHRRPELQFVIPAAPSLRAAVELMVQRADLGGRVLVLDGQSHLALAACDVTLIASGTATLEAALFKRPMVIAYNMNWISWEIMKRQRLQPWVGLPNILCGRSVVPEFLQNAAQPTVLADSVEQWLNNPAACNALTEDFCRLHDVLRKDTVALATDAIAGVLHA